MKRTFVKICGITTVEQGIEIAEMGADAIGFILHQKSPRYIPPQEISIIIASLPPFTKCVGVFVNEPLESLLEIMHATGLDIAQLSGDESEAYTRQLTSKNIQWLQAFRIREAADIKQVEHYSARYLLLDAWSEDAYGGTGQTFDWKLLDGIRDHTRIILAGGINPDNIEDVIRDVRPFAVDVSSGVEISPGIKDLNRVKQLLDKISHTSAA